MIVLAAAALTAVGLANLGTAAYTIALVATMIVVPVVLMIRHSVVKPLRWVLGVSAKDSPTGEEIPSLPVQLANIHRDQAAIHKELHPNGGGSLRDVIDFNAISLEQSRRHMRELEDKMEQHDADEHTVWKFLTDSLIAIAAGQADAAQIAEKAAKLVVTTATSVKSVKEVDARAVAKTAVDTAFDLGVVRRQDARDVAQTAVEAAASLSGRQNVSDEEWRAIVSLAQDALHRHAEELGS